MRTKQKVKRANGQPEEEAPITMSSQRAKGTRSSKRGQAEVVTIDHAALRKHLSEKAGGRLGLLGVYLNETRRFTSDVPDALEEVTWAYLEEPALASGSRWFVVSKDDGPHLFVCKPNVSG